MRIIMDKARPTKPFVAEPGQRFAYDHDGRTELGTVVRVRKVHLFVRFDDGATATVTRDSACAWFRGI